MATPSKEEWYVVTNVRDGTRLGDPRYARAVFGPWSKSDAEAKTEMMRKKHPGQPFIAQHEREAMRGVGSHDCEHLTEDDPPRLFAEMVTPCPRCGGVVAEGEETDPAWDESGLTWWCAECRTSSTPDGWRAVGRHE